MAQCADLSPPIISRGAGIDPDQPRPQLRNKLQHLSPTDGSQIEADNNNLFGHGRLRQTWLRMAAPHTYYGAGVFQPITSALIQRKRAYGAPIC